MNIPMLNRTNQLQIFNLISMILIGHPIYVALIGILTIYNRKRYIHLSTKQAKLSNFQLAFREHSYFRAQFEIENTFLEKLEPQH